MWLKGAPVAIRLPIGPSPAHDSRLGTVLPPRSDRQGLAMQATGAMSHVAFAETVSAAGLERVAAQHPLIGMTGRIWTGEPARKPNRLR